ncbi:MAG: response regulator, partial [Hyphomicrobiaceae bacterium]
RTLLVCEQAGRKDLEAYRAVGCDAYLLRPVRPGSLVAQLSHTKFAVPGAAPGRLDSAASVDGAGAHRTAPERHVLLVEDNAINALLAQRMCERAGCDVHHAPSGQEAVAYCEAQLAGGLGAVNLVLMDIHMPGLDGLETTGLMKSLFAQAGQACPPIIALTANAFAEDRKRCFEAGLDDYLAKPFDRSQLEALLDKWCPVEGGARDGLFDDYAA